MIWYPLMDNMWGISFACFLILTGYAISRDLAYKHVISSSLSATALIFIHFTGDLNFPLSIGMSFHLFGAFLGLAVVLLCALFFLRQKDLDLKLIALLGLIAFISASFMGITARYGL